MSVPSAESTASRTTIVDPSGDSDSLQPPSFRYNSYTKQYTFINPSAINSSASSYDVLDSNAKPEELKLFVFTHIGTQSGDQAEATEVVVSRLLDERNQAEREAEMEEKPQTGSLELVGGSSVDDDNFDAEERRRAERTWKELGIVNGKLKVLQQFSISGSGDESSESSSDEEDEAAKQLMRDLGYPFSNKFADVGALTLSISYIDAHFPEEFSNPGRRGPVFATVLPYLSAYSIVDANAARDDKKAFVLKYAKHVAKHLPVVQAADEAKIDETVDKIEAIRDQQAKIEEEEAGKE